MGFKKFLTVNAKRIIGVSLLLSLMGVQTVGATSGISSSLKSTGNIEYDANGDGSADVLFYSKDLNTIATGIETLDGKVDTLSTAYDTLTASSNTYKTNIINALNGSVYKTSNIPSTATYSDIVGYITNIPAPTTATGTYYTSGDNSGLGVGLSGSNTSADVSLSSTTLNLGVNEAITIPSGYYPDAITIQNNVVNRGSYISGTISQNGYFQEGYYPSFYVDVSSSSSNRAITLDGPNTYSTSTLTSGSDTSGKIQYTFTQDGYCYNVSCSASSTTPKNDTEHTKYSASTSAKLYDSYGNLVKDFGSKSVGNGVGSATLSCGAFLVYEGDYIIASYTCSSSGERKGHSLKLTQVSFISAE